jgi:hypothetical protein
MAATIINGFYFLRSMGSKPNKKYHWTDSDQKTIDLCATVCIESAEFLCGIHE